jgi:activator of HSP90 ATPase
MQLMQPIATRRAALWILSGGAAALAQDRPAKSHTVIHQEVDLKAPAARIYGTLLDAKEFAAFTGAPAEIQAEAGGSFKLFGGQIVGRNIELVPNRRIVQAWREPSWPAGDYTVVKFELVERGGGTRIVFDQVGIKEEDWTHLNQGWGTHYWEPLRKHLKA